MNGSNGAGQSAVMELRDLVGGFRITQLLHVVARLNIADALQSAPKTAQALATECGVDAHNLHRVLRALASQGIFAEDADGRFTLTRLAEPLCSDAPESVRHYAIMQGEPWMWRPMGRMMDAVRTGEVPFEDLYDDTFFQYLARQEEWGAIYNRNVTNRSRREAQAVLQTCDFSGVDTLVDVGGGQGNFLATVLERQPDLSGVLLDLPSLMPAARELMQQRGVADRARLVGGDFFASVPDGGDVYVLQAVLHDWSDERALKILENCRNAMQEGTRLVVVDTIIPPGNAPDPVKMSEVTIMVVLGGRDRSEAEFRAMLAETGFALDRVTPVPPRTILEAHAI